MGKLKSVGSIFLGLLGGPTGTGSRGPLGGNDGKIMMGKIHGHKIILQSTPRVDVKGLSHKIRTAEPAELLADLVGG